MSETPMFFVGHGDDGGLRVHPGRRVQEALRAADGRIVTRACDG